MENQELWLKIRTREKGGLSPSFLRLQALPFSDRLRFTRNELWVASQIIQERKAACSWHPSFLTASPHLQIKQIYHSVMGAAEGGRGGGGLWNALALTAGMGAALPCVLPTAPVLLMLPWSVRPPSSSRGHSHPTKTHLKQIERPPPHWA